MPDTLLSVSEQIIGLILIGKQTSTSFSPDKLHGKYAPILIDIKNGKPETELVVKYGNLIKKCKYAEKLGNGMGDDRGRGDYLNKIYTNTLIEDEMGKALKYIGRGETDKFDDSIRRILTTRQSAQRLRSMSADEISDEYSPFIRSGSPMWDNHIGGLPNVGLTILAGQWGDGKTTDAIIMMDNFLREWKEKEVLFVTLEDMAEGWKERAKVVLGKRSNEFWKRVKIMEVARGADEIIEEAARYPDVGLIVMDYVDYLAKGKNLEAYEDVYKALGLGAKSLAVTSKFRSMPIIVLAQYGRGASQGGVPSPRQLMYTGEQYAYQLVMLYDPNSDFYSDNKQNPYTLPCDPGYGYVCVWKVKNGNRMHKDSRGKAEKAGAIKVPMLMTGGFDFNAKGEWFSLSAETKRAVPDRK